MHPILTQPLRLLQYFGAWTVYGLLLTLVLILGDRTPIVWTLEFATPLSLLLGLLTLSCWYMVKALPAGAMAWTRLIGAWAFTSILFIAVWLAAGLWWAEFLWPDYDADKFIGLPLRIGPLLALSGFIATAAVILSHYLYAAFENSRKAQEVALQSQVLQREAELKSLRSQLDPHFLFNSLNSVAALIGVNTDAARRMCLLMAGFFRQSVRLGRESEIALAEELQLIETFLAIEEVRFGDRLRKRFDIADEVRNLAVPPLMLQPLVENAVHHGIAHLLDGGEILVAAQRRDTLLQLTVSNACDPDRPPSRGTGTGLANVRARLETVYGHEAQVESAATPTSFSITLLLPANPISPHQSSTHAHPNR